MVLAFARQRIPSRFFDSTQPDGHHDMADALMIALAALKRARDRAIEESGVVRPTLEAALQDAGVAYTESDLRRWTTKAVELLPPP